MTAPVFDFYLSEISISDGHGGGISLQRVIGDDVDHIARFLHLSRFADERPPIERVRSRSETVLGPFESDWSRRWVGGRISDYLFRRRWGLAAHARAAASLMRTAARDGRPLRILVCPQKAVSLRTIEDLKRAGSVRYVTWFMDDHLVSRSSGIWRYPRRVRADMERHLRGASTVFVISPALGEFYGREFGISSQVLFCPAGPEVDPICEPPSGSGTATIGYFGRVWEWQLDEIIRFAAALRPGEQVLDIYSPDTAFHDRLRLPTIQIKDALPPAEVVLRMRGYDAVLVPIGFADTERNLTEFNIATKLSECLASGTVTIVYGPEYAAMVRLLRGTGAAHLMTDRSLRDWPRVAAAIKDTAERRRLLENARAFVRREASSEIMQKRWRAAVETLG